MGAPSSGSDGDVRSRLMNIADEESMVLGLGGGGVGGFGLGFSSSNGNGSASDPKGASFSSSKPYGNFFRASAGESSSSSKALNPLMKDEKRQSVITNHFTNQLRRLTVSEGY